MVKCHFCKFRYKESERKLKEEANISAAQDIMVEARKLLTSPINPSDEGVLISSLNLIKVNAIWIFFSIGIEISI